MNFFQHILSLLVLFLTMQLGFAQTTNPWTYEASPRQKAALQEQTFKKARSLSLNKEVLEKVLATAPLRFSNEAAEQAVILTLPSPNGQFNDFKIVEAPVLHPDLGRKFPAIKSYAGQGISDPTAYIRFAWSPHGFHGVIFSGKQGTVIIDTEDRENRTNQIVYYKKDRIKTEDFSFKCEHPIEKKESRTDLLAEQRSAGDCQLRTYRLALACTGEYARFHGGTTADVLAAMNASMTRINGIFERDLAVRLEIIPNNTDLIFLNANSDPYTNNNGPRMLDQNQSTVDNIIGNANYDIGHVFSTGGGGIACLGCVCDTGEKAAGVTGFTEPVGDQFDLDFVAHELGHQFGAQHTFSGDEGSCGAPGNISVSSAMEPGSGSTIMGYAQLCGSQDIQQFSDAYFHARSILEISSFILSAGDRCAQHTDLNNEAPTVEAGANFRIPKSTPFVLEGTASDVDNDGLTYTWEQMDRSTTPTKPPLSSNRSGPLFRSFTPTDSPQRYFPRLEDLVANINPTWEVLPAVNRNMNFRLTVRDNNLGGGCTDEDDMAITVNAEAGPFLVTQPNTNNITWTGNTTELVSWDVANTDVAPISARAVDIYLSLDGGFTYPELLVEGVPNTGSAEVVVPNLPTSQARIMVKGADNIFFDISNRNFTIVPTLNDFVTAVTPSSQAICTQESAIFDVNIDVSGSFEGPVDLSIQGLPNAFLATFSTNNFIPPNTSRLTIQTNGTADEGAYPFTLNISGSTGIQTRQLSVLVIDGENSSVQLNEPPNNAVGVTALPTFNWVPVTGANEYLLQIATSADFSSILVEETLNTTEYSLSDALELSTRYYWKVVPKGACFENGVGTTYSFLTAEIACEIFTPTDLPQRISPVGSPRVGSFLDVPISGTITDVNILNLDIDHSWVADLIIGVISPAESVAILVNEGICFGSEDLKLSFDDDADMANSSIPCPPTNRATYTPADSLSVFNGEEMEGEWALIILDEADEDGGVFNNWALEVCYLGESKVVPLTVSLEKIDETCANSQDGRISVSAVDGLGEYTYNWSNGATTATIENLSPAIYTVTVSDGSTTIEESITINAVAPIDFAITEVTPSCFGAQDGSIEISSSEALTYVWNTGAVSSTLDGLGAGTYTVEVTNAQNCKESRSFILTEPTQIINSITSKPITCAGGMDGAITLSLFDNNNPSFQWSNNATTQDIANVSAGTYSVTVTATNSCKETMEVTLTEPEPIRVVAAATTPSCKGGMDAQLTVGGTNGVAPYSYIWSTGATTDIVSSISAGTYQVTVTDSNGCSEMTEVTSAEASIELAIDLEVVAASCDGLSDGQITANVQNGLAPYTYLWSDGRSTEMIDAVSEGAYQVTVTDVNGCNNIAAVQVETPQAIEIDLEVINVSCFGLSDGQIVSTITGGSGEYTYLWNDGRTIKSLLDIPAGNYTVTVTDTNNCQAVAEMTVSQATEIDIDVSPVMISCNGTSDGQILTAVDPANGPYSYNWSNGSTAESIGNLPAGTYTLTVTNATTCEKVVSVELTEPNALELNSRITPISCNGLSDGRIDIDIVGARGAYLFTWDGDIDVDIDPFNENAFGSGTYGFTVTDETGCSVSEVFILEDPPLISARFASTSVSAVDSIDGQIITTVAGGTGDYTFAWSTGDSTANLSNVAAGTYTLTVTDANACSSAFTAIVQGVECFNFALDFNVDAPICVDMPDGRISAMANGGMEPYQYEWSTGDTTRQIDNLISGDYTLTVTDALGCSVSDLRVLEATSNIQLSLVSKSDYSCLNQLTGTATVAATGGSGDYTFIWSNGTTSAEVVDLEPGNYTVTVQDESSCAAVLEVVISSSDVVRPPVFRETTSVYLDASGGATLSSEMLLALAIDSCSIQQLELSDSQFDCEDLGLNRITVETTFIGEATSTQILNVEVIDTIKPIIRCPADIFVSACADTVFYDLEEDEDNCGLVVYSIESGLESGSVFSEDTTTVVYRAVDFSNNVASCSFKVIIEEAISVTVAPEINYEIDEEGVYIVTSLIDCQTPELITFFLANGGTGPYSYDINMIENTSLFERYSVHIMDISGCSVENIVAIPKTEDLSVTVNPAIGFTYEIDEEGTYIITSIEDCIEPDLLAFFLVNGGVGPYNFDISLLADSLMFKRYLVRITDVNGCTRDETVVVPISAEEGDFILNSDITPASIGAKDGRIELEVVEELALLFEWYSGDTLLSKERDLFDVSAGTYTLVIMDMFGCSMVNSFTVEDMTVSANDVFLANKIALFPNPTNGEITIEFDLDKQQKVEVNLYDVSGRLVLPTNNYTTKNDRVQMNLNTLAKGVYLARIRVEDGVLVRKIVLN